MFYGLSSFFCFAFYANSMFAITPSKWMTSIYFD